MEHSAGSFWKFPFLPNIWGPLLIWKFPFLPNIWGPLLIWKFPFLPNIWGPILIWKFPFLPNIWGPLLIWKFPFLPNIWGPILIFLALTLFTYRIRKTTILNVSVISFLHPLRVHSTQWIYNAICTTQTQLTILTSGTNDKIMILFENIYNHWYLGRMWWKWHQLLKCRHKCE